MENGHFIPLSFTLSLQMDCCVDETAAGDSSASCHPLPPPSLTATTPPLTRSRRTRVRDPTTLTIFYGIIYRNCRRRGIFNSPTIRTTKQSREISIRREGEAASKRTVNHPLSRREVTYILLGKPYTMYTYQYTCIHTYIHTCKHTRYKQYMYKSNVHSGLLLL